tara:strand:- start:148397 stop:149569 length:1173 start_codon:yes stop_codon:yes gene_type:complete
MLHGVEVICLLTSVRGGSKLFHSLVESHSQIVCFPRTFRFLEFKRKIKSCKSLDIARLFVSSYPRFFDGKRWKDFNILDRADELGENRNESFEVDTEKFINNFADLNSEEHKTDVETIINLHFAYHKARGLELPKKAKIFYHIHDITHFEELKFCFDSFGVDNLKVVFTTRHPIEGLNSCVQWMKIQKNIGSIFGYEKEVLISTSEINEKIPELDIKTVSLELIRYDRKKVLMSFCEWVGIDFEDSMLKSTIHGKSWLGNGRKPLGDKTDEVVNYYQSEKVLEKKDLRILYTMFEKRLKSFGIPEVQKYNSFFLRMLIFLPTQQEFDLLKLSVSPSYWSNVLDSIGAQEAFKKFLFGNPGIVLYSYLKRALFQSFKIDKSKDYSYEMLGM